MPPTTPPLLSRALSHSRVRATLGSLLLVAVIIPTVALGSDEVRLELIPRRPLPKLAAIQRPAQPSRLIVKFADDLRMRAIRRGLMSLAGPVPDDIQSIVDFHGLTFEPLIQLSAQRIAIVEQRVTQYTATEAPDLQGMLIVRGADDILLDAAGALLASDATEFVYFQEIAPPPPCDDIAPVTPQYFPAHQAYHGPDPGVNMAAAWQMGDTRGTGIVIADCEYGYVEGHEDLCDVLLEPGQTIHPTVRTLGWDEHGTAALGEIMSLDNGYGCTGLTPNTEGLFFTEWSVEQGPRRLTAITNAIASVNAGDIVVLEMQTTGPGGGYGPAELDPSVWTVVRAGADGGVIVVGAAGNGNQDLDSAPYAEYRGRGDSGAILVGAGSPNTGHDKLSFSTYGQRINVQGWGGSVFSLGYGDFAEHGGDKNQRYTAQFSGTSSATPFIAGSCAGMQSLAVEQLGRRLTPLEMRDLLISTGLDQGAGGHIGPFPNLVDAAQQIIDQSNRMRLVVGPLIGGQNGAFEITNAMPNQRAYLIYSLAGRGRTFVSRLNVTLDLASPVLGRSGSTDGNGSISWSVPIPVGGSGRTVWFQGAQFERTSAVVEALIE